MSAPTDRAPLKVGFIGLGDQGLPMAEAIAEAGHELHVWARRQASTEPLVRVATVEPDLSSLARMVGHLGLCVGNADDVRSILVDGGVLEAMRPGAIVAVHSTISPEDIRRLAALAAERGIDLIDAPVSGGRKRAQERRLLLMVGASQEQFDRALPVLTTYGDPVRLLGPVGAGQQAKVLNNLLMNANVTNSHLVLELGRHLGIDRAALRELLLYGTSASFGLEALDTIVIPGRLPLANGIKDLGIARGLLNGAPPDVQLLDRVVDIALEVRHLLAPH